MAIVAPVAEQARRRFDERLQNSAGALATGQEARELLMRPLVREIFVQQIVDAWIKFLECPPDLAAFLAIQARVLTVEKVHSELTKFTALGETVAGQLAKLAQEEHLP